MRVPPAARRGDTGVNSYACHFALPVCRRADRVPVSPLHQHHQHRVQVKALAGEPVLVPAALAAFAGREPCGTGPLLQPGGPGGR